MLLSEIVTGYIANPPVQLMVDETFVARCLKTAVRIYCGYAKLTTPETVEGEIHDSIDASNSIEASQDFDITPSEYGIIGPLFWLYVEKENAMYLEASRGLGVDVFGRPVSEIAADIARLEDEMPKKAFMEMAELI